MVRGADILVCLKEARVPCSGTNVLYPKTVRAYTNFWIVLALAGDSTITRVIPSFAFSQMVAELIIFAFDLVANNLTLLVNDFRNSFMA